MGPPDRRRARAATFDFRDNGSHVPSSRKLPQLLIILPRHKHFVGRFEEPRKGMEVLLAALELAEAIELRRLSAMVGLLSCAIDAGGLAGVRSTTRVVSSWNVTLTRRAVVTQRNVTECGGVHATNCTVAIPEPTPMLLMMSKLGTVTSCRTTT